MTEKGDFHYWRDEMARLVGLREAQEARRMDLQRELIDLDARRGAAALAALGGGDAEHKSLQLVERELTETRGRVDTVDSLLRAAAELVADGKVHQRAAVAMELRRQADVIEAEVQTMSVRISALCAELTQLMGAPPVVHPNNSFSLKQQTPARLRGAADMVAAGGGCPVVDPSSGRRADHNLW